MTINKVKLTKVYLNDKSKDGKPLITSTGKPYQKIAIQTDQHAGYISKLIFNQDDPALQFKEGDEVELIIWEENGYKNFKIPNKTDWLELRIEDLENDVKELKELLNTPDGRMIKEPEEYPEDAVRPDDLPF